MALTQLEVLLENMYVLNLFALWPSHFVSNCSCLCSWTHLLFSRGGEKTYCVHERVVN